MRPAVDYSNELRQKLADGRKLDEALGELRTAGASMFDCMVSVRTLRRCDLAEAKQVVQASAAWADYRDLTEEFVRELSKPDDNNVA